MRRPGGTPSRWHWSARHRRERVTCPSATRFTRPSSEQRGSGARSPSGSRRVGKRPSTNNPARIGLQNRWTPTPGPSIARPADWLTQRDGLEHSRSSACAAGRAATRGCPTGLVRQGLAKTGSTRSHAEPRPVGKRPASGRAHPCPPVRGKTRTVATRKRPGYAF